MVGTTLDDSFECVIPGRNPWEMATTVTDLRDCARTLLSMEMYREAEHMLNELNQRIEDKDVRNLISQDVYDGCRRLIDSYDGPDSDVSLF